jgi:rare lipoprotein A (peptidoglycan hydrolase)
MKYIIALVAILVTTTAQAGFIDDLFGGFEQSQVQNSKYNKHSKHINNYSTGGGHNASWYNDRSGRTASGMRHHYGVAHKTLPFGARVCIHNPSNGRQVEAVVTDRGPFVKGRTIDVNQNVARALGFSGTAHLNYHPC